MIQSGPLPHWPGRRPCPHLQALLLQCQGAQHCREQRRLQQGCSEAAPAAARCGAGCPPEKKHVPVSSHSALRGADRHYFCRRRVATRDPSKQIDVAQDICTMQRSNCGKSACKMRSHCLRNADVSRQAFLHLSYNIRLSRTRGRWNCTWPSAYHCFHTKQALACTELLVCVGALAGGSWEEGSQSAPSRDPSCRTEEHWPKLRAPTAASVSCRSGGARTRAVLSCSTSVVPQTRQTE